MKRLLIIFLILLGVNTFSQHKNDLQKLNLKGKVKYLNKTTYKAIEKNGKIEKEEMEEYWQYLFDKKGYTKEVKYKNAEFHAIHEYDHQGNLIKIKFYDLLSGSLEGEIISKYDEKGHKIEKNNYNSARDLETKTIYKYDEYGNLIEEYYYNSEGSLENKYTYKYSTEGYKIEENAYNSKGDFDEKRTYKYDERGNIMEVNSYNSEGKLNYSYIYIYDNKGDNIETNQYNSEGVLSKKWTFEHKNYDKQGNWIKKVEYENDKPTIIVEREIEYY